MRSLTLLVALSLAAAAAARTCPPDTLDLYGGPGTLAGKFQTADGLPDPQGWVGVDDTAPTGDEPWQVSTRGAGNLHPEQPANHAWWCGADFPACVPGDSAWGYGNAWNTALGTVRTVDPSRAATVTVTGRLNVAVEPDYDAVRVEVVTAGGATVLRTFDGFHDAVALDVRHTLQPGDYTGDRADEVHVRLRVTSDGGWSDEDCSFPTAGAVQADDLQLVVEQPGLPPDAGPVETCEPGDPSTWAPEAVARGTGSFAQLWTGLDDRDPARDNPSPQWAFLNDGEIVPWQEPSLCWTRCYGPDSLSVFYGGGGENLRSAILSPPIALPDGWSGTLRLAFDAYHDPSMCYPVHLDWALHATDDPAGEEGWVERWYPFLLVEQGPAYRRWDQAVPDDLVPAGTRWVRIKLRAYNLPVWCWGPQDSPAPYLDNVRLQLGPASVSDAPDAPGGLVATAAPNPFNPAVVIRWSLPAASDAFTVRVHDARGRLVRSLRGGPAPAGAGQVTWRGRDDAGQAVAAGVYFCRLSAASGTRLLKVTLLK